MKIVSTLFESTKEKCYAPSFIAANLCLAFIDGALAFIAFLQLNRFYRRNKRAGWTRQKVLHLMIGSSNTGSVVYFVASIIATCTRWHHWSNGLGFLLMAFPNILFLATFLLLLSFWVDVCHQGNGEEDDDDDEEEENSIQQVLLEKSKSKAGSSNASDRRKCCSFHGIHVGIRQKFVVAAVVLVFILMISFAILIWIASGKNPIDSSLLAEVYVDIVAAIILITGGGICFYGLRLLFNLRKVRSEQVSAEMCKVSGLAGVSVVCFNVSSLIALLTHIPLLYHWNPRKLHGIKALVLLIIYYFIGSTVPLAFVLWVLRELPPQNIVIRQEEPRRITYVNYETVAREPPQQWASTTVSKNQIPIAVDMAKYFRGKEDAELFRKIKSDSYMYFAVIESYETLKKIVTALLEDDADRRVMKQVFSEVDMSIQNQRFIYDFRMSGLPLLSDKLEKFLYILLSDNEDQGTYKSQLIHMFQDVIEVITQDLLVNGHEILERARVNSPHIKNETKEQRFEKINIHLIRDKCWREKIVRLHLLLSVKESAINVPQNLEARRRITFFANSLFMNMPSAPRIRDMLSFSVLTPSYKEDVLYSEEELNKENEDGISILFYLQKIYPDEWTNFLDRVKDPKLAEKDKSEFLREWVSYRVRGMVYYRQALELQCYQEVAGENAKFSVYQAMASNDDNQKAFLERAKALAGLKFTYVVSCQVYGNQKTSGDIHNRSCYTHILQLMLKYPSLRVAYVDEREETADAKSPKAFYSVLLKGGNKLDEEIYRIKLPGPPAEIGEGKPENQNHAIIFTRGEALQTIEMNQDNYFEEAFKLRNVLEEFTKECVGRRKPTILGLREHIFTGSVSSLAWFMSNQESSFVTIGQRILANPLRVRFHYGHPDIFDRIFHITRGGVSKASKVINLSEDIFEGNGIFVLEMLTVFSNRELIVGSMQKLKQLYTCFNSTLRGGSVTHHEYIQVGRGRDDVGLNPISIFEAKVANGNGEQTLSLDAYRLGHRFDFYRMLSFYFTTIGFYFSSMLTVLTVYAFLYGRMYMVMSGLEKEIIRLASPNQLAALEKALASQSIFQLGFLMVLPMVMEIGLEKGFRSAIVDFFIMQLQLAPVFFTFQLGTKSHYYGIIILHGGSKYRSTGRGFVVFHAKFAENDRLYSRSHFARVKLLSRSTGRGFVVFHAKFAENDRLYSRIYLKP